MSIHNSGNNYGTQNQQTGSRSVMNTAPPSRGAAGAAGRSDSAAGDPGAGPRHALYAFADIVSYSRLNARLQQLSQHDLVDILRRGAAEAGVEWGGIAAQDQGDAQLLAFPEGTDTAKVLAVLPRFVNDELGVRNRDMAEHAWMRVRLALGMGMSVPGAAGLVGDAPVAVTRIANSGVFRDALRAAPLARCGLIIDDYLHAQLVRPGFRADIDPEDYAQVRVSYPDKGFVAMAWMKLFGYSGPQTKALLP